MEVKLKKLPKSMLEIEVTTDANQWEKAQKTALKKLSEKIKIDGFRKGHVPEEVLMKQIGGKEALSSYVIEVLLPQTYSEVVKEKQILVLAQPEVEIKSHQPFVYVAKVAVYPEVKLTDYAKIKIKKEASVVTKKEIDDWVEKFRKQVVEYKEVERVAKKGDKVEVDFEGFTLDGVPLDNTKSKNHPVVLGEGGLIPGFEDEIIGMKKGAEKEFEITFPKDYHAEKMAGQKVKFKIKLNLVSEVVLPQIDENFVQKITGTKKSVEDFRKEIETQLLLKKEEDARNKRENDWLKELIKKATMEIPEILLTEEVDFMIDDLKMQGLQQGLPWEHHLKHLQKTEEELRKDFQKTAEERIKMRLVAQEVIKQEKITVDDKTVEVEIKQILESQPAQQKEQYKKHYIKGGKGFMQLKNQLIFDKLFKKMLD